LASYHTIGTLQYRRPSATRHINSRPSQLLTADDQRDDDGSTTGLQQAQQVDEIARRGFPLAFLCLNVAYWAIYMPRSAVPTNLHYFHAGT